MKVIDGGLNNGKTASDAAQSAGPERTESLVGKIASEIAREILAGELPQGADLNSVELAARFGSSRTPVREALLMLEKEGLVEILPRKRPRVARLTWREVEEIYEIRAHLNALMMKLFVANAGPKLLREAKFRCDRMNMLLKRGDGDGFVAERIRLHDFWAEACGNSSLKKMLATWRAKLNLRRMATLSEEYMQRSLTDHQRLVSACEDKDAALAAALIHSMTMAGFEQIRQSGWREAYGGSEPR